MPPAIDQETRYLLAAPEAVIASVSEDMGNPDWNDAAQRVLIVRLSPFEDVAGSSAHLFLFSQCRSELNRAYIDFAFFPDARDRAILSARSLPFYYGLESGRAPEDFDLILVSNAFTLELVNLGYLFGPRLPSRSSARSRYEGRLPIVILGGSNAAAAGAALFPGAEDEASSDSLVDGIFFGEGEAAAAHSAARSATAALARALAGDPSAPRSSRLAAAAEVAGFWPALSGKNVSRAVARPYPAPLVSYPVLNSKEASTARLQISSGCHGLCSFCLEGWDRRPYREVPIGELLAAARELRARTGAETLELHSFNFNTHSSILGLIFELGRIFKRVNLMSQRVDVLARHPALIEAELAADKRSFTLGIEGISRRMRAFYRKGLGDEELAGCAAALIRPGVRELKLFYIISGIEAEEDFEELSLFASRLSEGKRERSTGTRILASAGFLVRLPFTPLQYAAPCLDRGRLEAVARRMRAICETEGIEFRTASDYGEHLADQLLALGGRALGSWLESAPAEGAAYDGGLSKLSAASLERFARGERLLGPDLLGEKGDDWMPPLSFLEAPMKALRENYRLAAAGEDRSPCLGLTGSEKGECSGCGACEEAEDVARITGHSISGVDDPGGRSASRIARLVEAKRRLASIFVRFELPESLARSRPEYRSSWLSRRIAERSPRESRALLEVEDALYGRLLERYWGEAAYILRGPEADRLRAAAEKSGLEILDESPKPERIEIEARFPIGTAGRARSELDAWLRDERIEVVETRAASGRRLECPPKSAKKGIVYHAELGSTGDEFSVRLSLGAKARPDEWLKRLSAADQRSASIRALPS